MQHQDGFFKGVRDANIYYQAWLPDEAPKGVLLIVHGLAEHSGRYMNVVDYFVPRGYAVYGLDHIGHGKSEGTRVFVERYEDYTDTLEVFFDMVRAWQPDLPIFLVGHSMGGLIAASFLLDHQEDFAGAVLSGPGVKAPDDVSAVTIFLGKTLSRLAPKVGVLGLDANGVSRDPAVVQAYVNDPLVYTGKTTARLAAELLKEMQRLMAEAGSITLPLLIVQGGADRLVDPAGAQMLYDRVSSSDKRLHVYDGFYHEVFNEPDHERVLSDVATWLQAHL